MTIFSDLHKKYAVVSTQEVAWGDMDAFNHVNNVMYYRYIESARLAYIAKAQLFEHGLQSVVFKNSCTYYSPVVYPDTLHIGVAVDEMRNSSLIMKYYLYSEAQQKLVAEADAVVVAFNGETGQKMPIPTVCREDIIKLEALVNNEVKQLG